ncbi:biotin carboxylase N-terminal domain-containing protein [Agromyces soli]|uniref:biotin carboxylase n=1 Tax=Agromyces soli TaxID=659012 RepID=A0ABY4ASG7_9MICO|nr:biotin carboxylase N-terminal domain-containing protein [Agromyces soli]UOE25804.1 ATP-grasp domain-containing protein [Agromyces soli]
MTDQQLRRSAGPRPFDRVLVANRGEIAVRVIRTLQRLGIEAVAVYSDADRDAPHVALADRAVRIGPAPAAESYLDPERLVRAAVESGAEAVHPGYGFLSEHAGFARACADAGLVFIGPGARALEIMGDKIRAKRHVAASGVPVVPGVADPALDDAALLDAAEAVGYPILVKPSAGGGGKGMQLARDREELAEALPTARRVASAAFGDDTLLLERFIERPRHIEVQVLADAHGAVVHLGERECSLQRRHQKVIEEAPSALLDEATRERIGLAACEAARSVDYRGAGTVEFLVSDAAPGEFFFIEMNTRLQVEHPVTELVTGVDLVEQQLRIAAGEHLALTQDALHLDGHAIEARLYAERPADGFLPATGPVLVWRPAGGDGVRIDAGLRAGQEITAHYDPMLAKLIAWGPDRTTALERLRAAIDETVVLGVDTNLEYLGELLDDPEVRAARLHTGLIDQRPAPAGAEPTAAALAAATALVEAEALAAAGPAARAWRRERGWRASGPGAEEAPASRAQPDAVAVRAPDRAIWVHADGRAQRIVPVDRRAELERRLAAAERGGAADPVLRAPMPGTVTAVLVHDGDAVETGAAILAIEAMKMEHRVVAPFAGVARLAVAVGAQVSREQAVATVEQLLAVEPSGPDSHPDPGRADPGAAEPSAHEATTHEQGAPQWTTS